MTTSCLLAFHNRGNLPHVGGQGEIKLPDTLTFLHPIALPFDHEYGLGAFLSLPRGIPSAINGYMTLEYA
jgi:hypothetical protein